MSDTNLNPEHCHVDHIEPLNQPYYMGTFEPAAVVFSGLSKTIMTFTHDGKVVVGDGFSTDEASRSVVETLTKVWAESCAHPGPATVKTMLDKLSPEDFLLAVAGRCGDCGTKTDGRTCHCDNDE